MDVQMYEGHSSVRFLLYKYTGEIAASQIFLAPC